jgi:hypothetical protein
MNRIFVTVLFLLFSAVTYKAQCSEELASSNLKTKTIIADGVGSDIETASQNAAENALMQVVGTFIDAQKQLDKRTEIVNGIKTQTKNIDTNIKEYSQGTIKKFKVVESHQEGLLIRLTAEIEVRIDDFHAYIKKLAEGETSVDDGLFVKMKSETKQKSNQTSLLIDNIISPVINGEVIKFSVEEPKLLSEVDYKHDSQFKEIDNLARSYNNVVVFRVNASLDKEFVKNMTKTLESTASQKISDSKTLLNKEESIDKFENYNNANDAVILFSGKNKIITNKYNDKLNIDGYLFKSILQDLKEKFDWLGGLGNPPNINLDISLLDSNDELLQREIVSPSYNCASSFSTSCNNKVIVSSIGESSSSIPWSFFYSESVARYSYLMILENRPFNIYMAVEPEAISKAKKIVVKLVK